MLFYGCSRVRELLMRNERYLLLVGFQACAIHPARENRTVQLCQPNGSGVANLDNKVGSQPVHLELSWELLEPVVV